MICFIIPVSVELRSEMICVLQSQLDCGFDFITVPLVDPEFKRPTYKPGELTMPYKWPDLLLVSAQYGSQVEHTCRN